MVNPYGNNEYGFLPCDQAYGTNIGSLTTYYGDSVDFSTYKGLWWGGDHKWGDYSGMFCFRSDVGTTLSSHKHGYRFVYYPVGGK